MEMSAVEVQQTVNFTMEGREMEMIGHMLQQMRQRRRQYMEFMKILGADKSKYKWSIRRKMKE